MIPPCWLSTTIGDLFDIAHGKSVTPRSRLGINPAPFLRTSNLFWGRIDLTELDEMDFTEQELHRMALNLGDLLVCEGGDIGRSAVWCGGLDRCGFQNHLHRLRRKGKKVDPFFIMYWLQTSFTLTGFYDGVENRTTIPNLSRARLAALEVPKPEIDEQRKIAALLWKIQQAIEVESDLIRVARELKAAVMQQLFTKGLRGERQKETAIGMVPESWEIRRLGQEAQKPEYGLTASAKIDVVGPKFLRITDITENGVKWYSVPYCKCTAQDEDAKRLYHDDIVFARIGATTGKSFIVKSPERAVFASYLIRIRAKESLIPDYLYHFFNSQAYWVQINANKGNTLKGGVNGSILSDLLVPKTTHAEQLEIAKILNTVDEQILLHEHKKVLLNELFQTLLHNLMSATIRVNDLDIDTSCLDLLGATV